MPSYLTIRHVEGKPGKVYYPLEVHKVDSKPPQSNEVVVRITAAALNHRDLFLRQALYPGVGFGIPLMADGCGVVVQTGANAKKWQNKRVVINPGIGWKDDVEGPESPTGYKILGGTKQNPLGTATEELIIDAGELEEAPTHLSSFEAAALPLAGLTAYRATVTKTGNAKAGRNILVTGIGGGVAIMSLLFAAAAGANVYVTSGNEDKIKRAVELGAKGGVNYKEKTWDKTLKEMLPKDRPYLDAIVDGAGSDIVEKGAKLLRAGGVISQYGMTVSPKMNWIMPAVLKNIELRGSTMGSRKEFTDMVKFVQDKGLKPIISKISKGGLGNISEIDALFEEMKNSSQFGKLVIEVANEKETAKL